MSANSNFFICSCAILVLTIINYKLGPIVTGKVGYTSYDDNTWALSNCKKMSDDYEEAKKTNPYMTILTKNEYELRIRRCKHERAMYNMEYTSIVFNGVIGFICLILTLKSETITSTGFIGMGCGIVGFILTLVYVIYNGIVYTHYYDTDTYKVDGKGAFAKLKDNSYKCFYYNEAYDIEALKAKYSDLIKSQYNYNKKLQDSFTNDPEKAGCSNVSPLECRDKESIPYVANSYYDYTDGTTRKQCQKLYYRKFFYDYTNYDKSACFLTVLLLSIIILLCYCGLIFSGFMVNKEKS